MQQDRQHLFDKPENVRRLLRFLYLACALLLAAELFVHRHVNHDWESLWGFYAWFGFAACVSLVLIARQLRKLLKRPEDYYER
jgi:membrane protein YdbS with pleckstrin-like domain